MENYKIIQEILDRGFKAYIVDETARDIYRKKKPDVYHVTTDASFQQLRDIFGNGDGVKTDDRLQLIHINQNIIFPLQRRTYDYTGNIVLVEAVSSIEHYLSNQKFTIDAMAIDAETDYYIDPYGGQKDIRRSIVRFTPNAATDLTYERFLMLKACRLLTLDNYFRFAQSTFEQIRKSAFALTLSKENVRDEILLAMSNPCSWKFFMGLVNTKLMDLIIPEVLETYNHTGGRKHNETVFEHMCDCCKYVEADRPILKLAAFLHDIGKPLAYKLNSDGSFRRHEVTGAKIAGEILQRLEFPDEIICEVTILIRWHQYIETESFTEKDATTILKN